MGKPNFSDEFKRDAVAQITERGYAVAEVSQRLGVGQHSLYAWKRKLAKVVSGDAGKDAEIRQLKRELARVTEECDILKKPRRISPGMQSEIIISHDRQTLFVGVPKNGSQTARAVLGHVGVDLVGEMGRHPTVPEAIRLAEERFPCEAIAPTAIYAFWRDPAERFCSALEFHKRCLPNSFIHLSPERFVGIEPHPRWFEPDPEAIAQDLCAVIESIPPLDILAALPPPRIPGVWFQPLGGNLSFYRSQSQWLDGVAVTILPFADYVAGLREVVDQFGGNGASVIIPQINAAAGPLPVPSMSDIDLLRAYYRDDLPL